MLTLSHSGDDLAKSLGALTISRTPRDQFSEKVSQQQTNRQPNTDITTAFHSAADDDPARSR